MIAHLFSFLGIAEQSSVDVNNKIQLLLDLSNGSAQVHLIDFRVTVEYAETPYAWIAMPLDRNFSIIGGVVRSQTKRCISTMKRTVGLKLECRLALW